MKVNIMSKNNTATNETNVVISAQVTQFVEQYKMCVKKTAQSILELADVVHSASKNLSKENYEEFRYQIGADKSKDSYLKKLQCIALQSSRFNAISDKLPPNYTTLYALSQLSDKAFQQIYSDDVISPQMTAKTLVHHKRMKTVAKKVKSHLTKQTVTFTLELQNIDEITVKKVIRSLAEVCKEFNIPYECEIDPIYQYRLTEERNSNIPKNVAA